MNAYQFKRNEILPSPIFLLKAFPINDTSERTTIKSLTNFFTMDELREHFSLPANEVADKLGVSVNFLKKNCRILKIKRWPYLQIKSLKNSIISLKIALASDQNKNQKCIVIKKQIATLEEKLDMIYADPNSMGNLIFICFTLSI